MKKSLETFCKDFLSAQKAIAKVEPLLSRFAFPICAEMFVEWGQMPDYSKLKKCDKLLVHKAGLFSDFSGMSALLIVTQLALSPRPEDRLGELQAAREILHKYFPPAPDYLTLAAISLTEADKKDWDAICNQAREIYKSIKKRHRLLSSGGDIVYAVLLAKDNADVKEIQARFDTIYKILRKSKLDPQSLLALCRVLAISGADPTEGAGRFLELYDKLHARGFQYGRDYQLPMLGLAAVLPMDLDEIADDIIDTDTFLSKQPNYSGLVPRYSKTVRLMHAAMLVCGCYNREHEHVNSNQGVVVAMEITLWMLFSVLFI